MVAESGAPLLAAEARQALIELLPRVTVVTPNLLEARALVEQAGGDAGADPPALARAIAALGAGQRRRDGRPHDRRGHASTTSATASGVVPIPGPRYPDGAAHGSGLHAFGRARGPPGAGPASRSKPPWPRR